ncbi:MAG: YqaE/Pmp3 family membrane protein [Bacillota bacterium]|nr:YqaE/Pmp3 family membrane protein [Bacillota bacterium]
MNVLYLIAILCPPLAVALCGKPMQAVLNFFLSLLFYFPGLIHAFSVVGEKKANERMQIQTQAIIKASKQE